MAKKAYALQPGWKTLLKKYAEEYAGETQLQVRLQGENEAKRLLEDKVGRFTEADIRDFFSALSADYWNEKQRNDRFRPAFLGSHAKQITKSRDEFNRWTQKLWQCAEYDIDQVLYAFWQENAVPGSGTSIPTAILYLRDPVKYAIWLPGLEYGLKTVLPSLKLKKRRTAEGYRVYNEAFGHVRDHLSLTPQSMDVVLSLASREADITSADDFSALFKEFVGSYVESKGGEEHLRKYTALRQQARQNYEEACEMTSRGEDVTDTVLLKLLPYTDTQSNRHKDAWVHVAPAVMGDIRGWFEHAGWVRAEDWPAISRTILEFVKRCVETPDDLAEHCAWFVDAAPGKGFQMGMLSPILNALNPDKHTIINNKSRRTLGYLTGEAHGNNLEEYPALNSLHWRFQEEHRELLEEVGQGSALHGDVLDMFCHWLVAVRKLSFKETRAYKIAPGAEAWNWEACRDGGYIAMGWDELGDVSPTAKEEFNSRRDAFLEQHPDFSKTQLGQVWRFSRIQEGDRIVANKGKHEILAFGTVLGPYYFVPNARHGHRLPVVWDDLTRRRVEEPSWAGTLQKISPERFEELRKAPPIDEPVTERYSIEALAQETGFVVERLERWLAALDRKKQAILYGPPGTGKTFLADRLSRHLVSGDDGFAELVQFHPEYAYQDFMQGIRPKSGPDGSLRYENVAGLFKWFCTRAADCEGKCVLIIDEINRANLSRVFGELMYLLEYRDQSVELSGGGQFRIPENVRIIGTMNTADRSIALVDYALRRRFAFIRLAPEYGVLEKAHADASFDPAGLIEVLKDLNIQIGDPHYEVGISFFLVDNLENEVEDIWRMEIEPYLEEYFFDNPQKAQSFGWDNVHERILA